MSDPEAVSTELDLLGRAEGGEAATRHDTELMSGGERIRATVRLSGNELTVNAIGERRIDSVLDRIREIDPAAVVRTETRQPIADTRAARRLVHQPAPKESPFFTQNVPPEVQQAMAEYIQNYEQEWLDLPVPALSGLTPRQAADDPTRPRTAAGFVRRRRRPDRYERPPAARCARTGTRVTVLIVVYIVRGLGYMKTVIDIDDEALRLAAAELGTKTKKDTVNAALQFVAHRHRRIDVRLNDPYALGVGPDIADPEVMRRARR